MFVSTRDPILGGVTISETDGDGVGSEQRLRVASSGMNRDIQMAEDAGRLLILALNMDGGIERAISLVRAETVRQRA